MDLAFSLLYYKRREVQEAIVREAADKECSVRFINQGFGKRPDILTYENDVIELAKKKTTSFHCSEELWFNPLALATGMKRPDLDALRKGWDLILDVDCPDWELSKLTTHLFIKALQDHGVKNVFCKFSGNKGFHVAVPFEAFPKKINYEGNIIEFKNTFPEGAKKIALYLLSYITENYAKIEGENVIFLNKHKFSFERLEKIAKKSSHSIIAHRCTKCKCVFDEIPKQSKIVYECSKCSTINKPTGTPELVRCISCGFPVEPTRKKSVCSNCYEGTEFEKIFNFFAVVDVDTILIASRHLYRMPYSLHEKSKLVSIPIDLKEVLTFEKESAKVNKVSFKKIFINRSKASPQEGRNLVLKAFEFNFSQNSKKSEDKIHKELQIPENALEETFFPPCIMNILSGLEDGKKRALFILMNFLRTVGWSYEQIKEKVYEWNELNPEPLREQYLKGQLHQIKKGKKPILPPSCSNKDYYKSLLICKPNEFCNHIKNPTHYTKFKSEAKRPKKIKQHKPTKKANYIVVDKEDKFLENKAKLLKDDIYRVSTLLIKNNANGILLGKSNKTKKWILPVQIINHNKETYVKAIKNAAKDSIGLRTFVPREGPKFPPKGKTNSFNQWFITLADRTINMFNPTMRFSELKWFSQEGLKKHLKAKPENFSKQITLIFKHKL